MLERKDYDEFSKELIKQVPDINCNGQQFCIADGSCEELVPKMKPLRFKMGGYYYAL